MWLKIEYILEFSQWLYSNEYKLSECIDLCEWSIDLLMFKVKTERVARSSSASTTQSRSGKQTKRKQPKQPTTPLIIVPESLNEDDTLMVITENAEADLKEIEQKELQQQQGNNFFGNYSNWTLFLKKINILRCEIKMKTCHW